MVKAGPCDQIQELVVPRRAEEEWSPALEMHILLTMRVQVQAWQYRNSVVMEYDQGTQLHQQEHTKASSAALSMLCALALHRSCAARRLAAQERAAVQAERRVMWDGVAVVTLDIEEMLCDHVAPPPPPPPRGRQCW
eukprot:NODE_5751_length_554_cov_61.372277_g5012_i0.p3 GENE.NODE_5751_length_554_cov_61.372277_g5012_i0~~NODE_5751_length_554_cov_61.372277_g5012_i0.p3  ORF type:complete len:137 (+),score=21.47 NODE_5751_length_554_cov_61.372277_g5012_i0:132-542(+)